MKFHKTYLTVLLRIPSLEANDPIKCLVLIRRRKI